MSNKREVRLEQLLRDIVNDFDQTGCSSDVGTVNVLFINSAREFLGMKLINEGPEPLDSEDD